MSAGDPLVEAVARALYRHDHGDVPGLLHGIGAGHLDDEWHEGQARAVLLAVREAGWKIVRDDASEWPRQIRQVEWLPPEEP